jgi:hypothetical protein
VQTDGFLNASRSTLKDFIVKGKVISYDRLSIWKGKVHCWLESETTPRCVSWVLNPSSVRTIDMLLKAVSVNLFESAHDGEWFFIYCNQHY